MKKMVILALLLLCMGGLGSWYWRSAQGSPVMFRTVPMKKGDLFATISATGTLEPEEVVDVGAQVQGQIQFFGKDPKNSNKLVDYGTEVEVGTVLAKIDDSIYAADVANNRAYVAQAKANLQRAQADLIQMKAKVQQTQNDWKRAQRLGGNSNVISGLDYDTTKAAYETAVSAYAVGEAAVAQAKSGVDQAEAALHKSEVNLGYCTIVSPVKGVIVDRRVNIGQTVVASLNAPSLFLIAKDLKRMQVWASVNEADIGQIHRGQSVRFTVDAFPGQTFKGTVGQVRLNATMTQNVVTYTVEVNTDNSSGKLLPYMTANLQFEIAQRKDVEMVPNAALRWLPSMQQVAPQAREEYAKLQRRKSGSGERHGGAGQGSAGRSDKDKEASRDTAVVWVEEDGFVRPVHVRAGLTDGQFTEISGKELTDGLEVVMGEVRNNAGANAGTTNPFAPQLFGGRK
jgi:HlyD family secretion protein